MTYTIYNILIIKNRVILYKGRMNIENTYKKIQYIYIYIYIILNIYLDLSLC